MLSKGRLNEAIYRGFDFEGTPDDHSMPLFS